MWVRGCAMREALPRLDRSRRLGFAWLAWRRGVGVARRRQQAEVRADHAHRRHQTLRVREGFHGWVVATHAARTVDSQVAATVASFEQALEEELASRRETAEARDAELASMKEEIQSLRARLASAEERAGETEAAAAAAAKRLRAQKKREYMERSSAKFAEARERGRRELQARRGGAGPLEPRSPN